MRARHPFGRVPSRPRGLFAVLVVAAGLALPAACRPAPPVARRLCDGAAPVRTGTLQPPDLKELSGLAASRVLGGVLWAHNDSGDLPRLFAIDRAGARRATLAVNVAAAADWEDLAIDGTNLYVGDIGDNARARPTITVHRVREPALDATAVNATTFTLRYPDGAHDAEALMVDPIGRKLVVVTKEFGGNSGVYTTSLDTPGQLQLAVRLQLGPGQLVTAGDINVRGDAIALRTYGRVFVWNRAGTESIAAAMRRPPCRAPAPPDAQGEALALLPTGDRYMTASEGVHVPLWQVVAGTGSAP